MDSNTSRDPPAWAPCVERIIAGIGVRRGANAVRESRRVHDSAPYSAPYSKRAAQAALRGPLLEAIDRERARLMTADSLLGSIAIAMQGADGETARVPYFPDLVELARELVNEAINGLDSNELGRSSGGGRRSLKPIDRRAAR